MSETALNPYAPALIRTPDQRLRVFVSSTLQELSDERNAAKRAIGKLRLAPVMFELGARPHPPRDLYRAYLEQAINYAQTLTSTVKVSSEGAVSLPTADGINSRLSSHQIN